MTRSLTAATIWLFMLLAPGAAWAHSSSESFLTLSEQDGKRMLLWEVADRDLPLLAQIDRNSDGTMSWGEVKASESELLRTLNASLDVVANGERIQPVFTSLALNKRGDGTYVAFSFSLPAGDELTFRYRLLQGIDSLHRGFLLYATPRGQSVYIFSPDKPEQTVRMADSHSTARLASFVTEGVWHIWTGYDHLLFLIVLLLPSCLKRERGLWKPRRTLKDSLLPVIGIVSAFTVAHSLTLLVAGLGLIQPNVRLVESAIALSVAIAALNNVFPLFSESRVLIAFGFGLIHGFGFANILTELGVAGREFVAGVVLFNIGVEIGQLAVLLLLVPLLYALKDTSTFRRFLLPIGSCAVLLVGCLWFVERALGVAS